MFVTIGVSSCERRRGGLAEQCGFAWDSGGRNIVYLYGIGLDASLARFLDSCCRNIYSFEPSRGVTVCSVGVAELVRIILHPSPA